MTTMTRDETIQDRTTGARELAATMQAIVQERYGSSETLRLDTVSRPSIEADEVLIEVHAAGVDRGV